MPPSEHRFDRGDALAELALRYFRSRGPATLDDFAWWSGLGIKDARAGLEAAAPSLACETLDRRSYWYGDPATTRPRASSRRTTHGHGTAVLLPAFDEYLVAYRDRSAVLDPAQARRINAGGGLLAPCVVVDGQVIGLWRRTLTTKRVAITIEPFDRASRDVRDAIAAAAERYGAFLALETELVFAPARS